MPSNWLRYTVPKVVTVMDWMADLAERLKQLIRIVSSDNLKVCLLTIDHKGCKLFFFLKSLHYCDHGKYGMSNK